jgi:endogenous inhibitor of DNA gyrase (YacG/DUF329 family)
MASPRRCPICKKPLPQSEEGQRHRPFCSRRCKDIDLSRWLTGSYAIPVAPDESEDEEDEKDGSTGREDPPVRH